VLDAARGELARVADRRLDDEQLLAAIRQRDADRGLPTGRFADPHAVALDHATGMDVLADDRERRGRGHGQRAIPP
jgi:hypothetical protein